MLVSGAGQSKTPIPYRSRSRYASELHPDSVDNVKKMLKTCKRRKDFHRETAVRLLTIYAIVLPASPESYGLIDQRNRYLKQLLSVEKFGTDTGLAMLFYQAIIANLFTNIDKLDTSEWNGKEDKGVKHISLPMLSIIQDLIQSAHRNSFLFRLFTSSDFASDLVRLGNSPIVEERSALKDTLLVFQRVLGDFNDEKGYKFFLAAFKVMADYVSKLDGNDRSGRYEDILEIHEALAKALSAKNTIKFKGTCLRTPSRHHRNSWPVQRCLDTNWASSGIERIQSWIYGKIKRHYSLLVCLTILLLTFVIHSLLF
jgi:hypothetical protein